MTRATHTWQEIASQPEVWQATLNTFNAGRASVAGFLKQAQFDRILVVGCGSTHYLAQAAAATLTKRAGVSAQAYPSSELWLYPDKLPLSRTLLLAISRSGATTETLYAVDAFKKRGGGPVVAVTCYADSPLAGQADLSLVADQAHEESVAQTRSFTSMLLLTQALAALLGQDDGMLTCLQRLPDVLAKLVQGMGELPEQLGQDQETESIFFLGGGALYGVACEAMLKTKEMSLSYAEAYHPLEFRHGPMSMVNRQTLVIGLLSDCGLAQEIKVLADMQNLGARVVALVDDATALNGWRPNYLVELRSLLDEWERQPLYLPVLQRLAYHRAVAKGLDPDRPTHLQAVIRL
jgi:glucosamine--fructose-6-phosphate aminotransferase (isomerizing)